MSVFLSGLVGMGVLPTGQRGGRGAGVTGRLFIRAGLPTLRRRRALIALLLGVIEGCTLLAFSGGCERAPAQEPVANVAFAADLARPRGVAVAPSGRVFVVDMGGFVTRFSAAGQFEHRWGLPDQDRGTPTGLFADDRERVFVADTHNSRVLVYDVDGREVGRFGTLGTGPGEFLYPNDVVVGRDGIIYVSEYGGNDRVSSFTPQFEFITSFGGPESAPAALAGPYGMAMDAAGTLWVADTGNHRVCRFDREGALIQTIGGVGKARGELRYPHDIAWIPNGQRAGDSRGGLVLVCEKANHRVQVFSTDGCARALWGAPGRGTGHFDSPTGIAVAAGRVLVADAGNNRVVVVRLESLLADEGVGALAAATPQPPVD